MSKLTVPFFRIFIAASGARILELASPTNETDKQTNVLVEKYGQLFPAETHKVAWPWTRRRCKSVGGSGGIAKECDASAGAYYMQSQ
jgi:hypothetical protein